MLDIQPVVDCGRRPAKAVTGEVVGVSATVFREGHEMLGAGVVLRDPVGNCHPIVTMRQLTEGTDSYGADVSPTGAGLWHFRIEAWGDPIAHWRHDAAIKVPIGQDVDLMLAEGGLLFDRAAREAGSTIGEAPLPAREAGSAVGDAPLPAREAGSAVGDAPSPAREAGSAVGDAPLPAREAGSAVGDAPSPAREAGS